MNRTINKLAASRVKHNRSVTVLTMVAIVLTTTLLMALVTAALGSTRADKVVSEKAYGNHHGQTLLTDQDVRDRLALHMDVESLYSREFVGTVMDDNMRARLIYAEEIMPGINVSDLEQGRYPEAENEIAGIPDFFEKMGVTPAIGETVSISYRVQGEGEIQTQDFVISGLEAPLSGITAEMPTSDLMFGMLVSSAFAEKLIPAGENQYFLYFRVQGEDQYNAQQMEDKIEQVASDVGYDPDDVTVNAGYLMWVVGLNTDIIMGVTGISLAIVVFCSLVIYGIFYVSVITQVQEIGRLQALGMSPRQVKKLLWREGLLQTAISLPIGLVLGYTIGATVIRTLNKKALGIAVTGINPEVSMVSLPLILLVVALVLVTVWFSLRRPMKIAAKISPIEAIRYQEQATGKQSSRTKRGEVTLTSLGLANLSRNRRRTMVTMATLVLGGVLFLAFSGILNGISDMAYARHELPKGDFFVGLDYSTNEETYTELNLEEMQQRQELSMQDLQSLQEIPGVARVEAQYTLLADVAPASINGERRISVGPISREEFNKYKDDHRLGLDDYDDISERSGVISTWPKFMEYNGYELDQPITMSFYDGTGNLIPFETAIVSAYSVRDPDFLIPEELFWELPLENDALSGVFLWVEDGAYDQVKAELEMYVGGNEDWYLQSLDEALASARLLNGFTILAAYSILVLLGTVCFLSLVNTMVTSVVTRKREFALLQAVGMSGKQLSSLLRREGLVLTLGSSLLSVVLGNVLGYAAHRWAKVSGISMVGDYQFPIVQNLLFVGCLVGGQLLISWLSSRYVNKTSLQERIRA